MQPYPTKRGSAAAHFAVGNAVFKLRILGVFNVDASGLQGLFFNSWHGGLILDAHCILWASQFMAGTSATRYTAVQAVCIPQTQKGNHRSRCRG